MDELERTIETYDGDVSRYIAKLEFPLPKKGSPRSSGRHRAAARCGVSCWV